MKTKLLLSVLLLSGCALRAAEPARPAEIAPIAAPPPSVVGQPQLAMPRDNASQESTFNFSFGGGSPQDLVEQLSTVMRKKDLQEQPNVIISANARDVAIPPFELRNVTLHEVFSALMLLGQREGWTWQSSARNEPPRFGGGAPPKSSPVWVLLRTTPSKSNEQKEGEVRVQVFNIGYLLGKLRVEDITTAIETVWQMDNKEGARPQLKYHKDTQLLIARGSPAQLSVVSEVLRELAGGQEKERIQEKAGKSEPKAQKS